MSGTNYIASNWRTPTNQNSSKNDNYSLDFNGSSDFISCGNDPQIQLTGDISISVWFKTSSNSTMILAAKKDSPTGGSTFGWQVYCTGGNIALTVTRSGPTTTTAVGGTNIADGEWHHVLCTINQDSQIAIILDGSTEATASLPAGTFIDSNSDLRIGYNQVGAANYYFNGEISEVALFDYLASGATLYGNATSGSGNPMALKPTPVGYWPLGDNSASDPLAQPNVSVDDASVFDFDGINDYIDVGDMSQLSNASAITVSLWFNPAGNSNKLLLDFKEGSSRITVQRVSNSQIYLYVNTVYAVYNITTSTSNWYNLGYVFDGSGASDADRLKLYINGSEISASSFSGTVPSSIGAFTSAMDRKIGSLNNGSFSWLGSINEVAIFTSAKSSSDITSIYNSGVPGDLSSLNPTAWWKLDQSANWEADTAGNWQIPNAVSEFPQSFNFSPVDEYFDTGLNPLIGASNLSVSVWFNSADVDFQIPLGDNSLRFSIKQSNGDTRITFTGSVDPFRAFGVPYNISEWNHLILTFDGSLDQADRLKLYHNGVALSNINAGTPNTTLIQNGAYTGFKIGRGGSTSISNWNGKISNVQLWDATLSPGEVTTLYNGGTPTLTPPNQSDLKAWYKLDQSANWDVGGSGNWTIPDASGNGNDGTSSGMTSGNLVLSDLTRNLPYENYSLEFDGTADYINHGNVTGLNNAPNASWSFWMNPSATGFRYMFSAYGTSGPNQQIYFGKKGTGVSIRLRGQGYAGGTPVVFNESSQSWTLGQWYHVVVTFDGAESDNAQKVKVYVNGNPLTNTSVGAAITNINTTTENFYIALLGGYTTNEFGGNISNMAIWNNTLSSTEVQNLYANGMPQDLTTFTPQPINWWTLGKESFWDGADWVIRDMIGTNDGLSDNMGGSELKGDAPRSQANGVGTNIAVPTDLKGQAGWSDKNGYSINMSSTARTTDTP